VSGAIDTNLLLYAEDEASPFHRRALEFLNHLLESGVPVYATWDVIHAFLRIATNLNVFSHPLTPEEATGDIQKVLDHPSVTILPPSLDSWAILLRLTKELHLRGNLIPDAVTASILEANGIQTVYTNDRDFWKFPGLKPVDPFR
jgi:toxin-antitoxin system PIN domain toxin